MDKNRIEGSAKQAQGAVTEIVGTVLGDAKLKAAGKDKIFEGKVQNAIGGVMDLAKEAK